MNLIVSLRSTIHDYDNDKNDNCSKTLQMGCRIPHRHAVIIYPICNRHGFAFGLLSILMNKRYAPGTPAGNCLKNASDV